MHHKPLLPYNGLTILLSEASRFDTKQLLTGYAGEFFWNCLFPHTRVECDIRTVDITDPLLPKTNVVLALGDRAASLLDARNSLNEIRGCPFKAHSDGPLVVASYAPQDAFDRRDYSGADDPETEDKDDRGKGHGKTKRQNWRFWLHNDLLKVKQYLAGGIGSKPVVIKTRIYNYLQLEEFLATSVEEIFFDIETTSDQYFTCFSLGYFTGEVFHVATVPWKSYQNRLCFDDHNYYKIIQKLSKLFYEKTIICHNASFDLMCCCWRYKIPFPRVIRDTMLMWHRCYPEVEQSLGHLISFFLDRPYHKSDGVYDPKTYEQQEMLLNYNCEDVITLGLVYKKLIAECVKLGTLSSALEACRYVRPYLKMAITGAKLDVEKLKKKYEELEFDARQLIRCLQIVTGEENLNPRSPKQVAKYLYEDLGLDCPNEDAPTNEKTLLKVLTKTNVPSIKLILAIRGKRTLASKLKFIPWGKDNDRFTTSYKISGTDTFRLGSRSLFKFKPFKGYGGNFQNWHKSVRELIIAG